MKLSYDSFQQHLSQNLRLHTQDTPLTLLVAYSGGLDSTVLLHLCCKLQEQYSGYIVNAIHINHQLQTAADEWQKHCESLCREFNIPLISKKVDIKSDPKSGTEAAAREARYQVFSELLKENQYLLTAHHKDDQVETLLLRLLRGTGLDGVAAMKALRPFASGWLMRPLLIYSRGELETYARVNHLHWVDDPSNSHNSYDRNFLRNEILPLLESRWPGYRETLSRFTVHAQTHQALLEQCLDADYQHCIEGTELNITNLRQYDTERQKYFIRRWISSKSYTMPGEKQLAEIFKLINAQQDAQPLVAWSDVEMRRFQNKLYLAKSMETFDASQTFSWNPEQPLLIPGVGVLHCITQDITSLPELFFIAFRQGGEECQLPGKQGSHSLKKIFQEHAVPPWLRYRTPLILMDGAIKAIPGIFSSIENIRFELECFNVPVH